MATTWPPKWPFTELGSCNQIVTVGNLTVRHTLYWIGKLP